MNSADKDDNIPRVASNASCRRWQGLPQGYVSQQLLYLKNWLLTS